VIEFVKINLFFKSYPQLGENALRAHLPQKSPQFAKKNEKLPMNQLQKKKSEFPKPDSPKRDASKTSFADLNSPTDEVSNNSSSPEIKKEVPVLVEDVKIADLFVPLATIKPG
jgi:hypothetical protein